MRDSLSIDMKAMSRDATLSMARIGGVSLENELCVSPADGLPAGTNISAYDSSPRHKASFCSKLRAACAGLDEGSTTVS